jgi:hypothetical protein
MVANSRRRPPDHRCLRSADELRIGERHRDSPAIGGGITHRQTGVDGFQLSARRRQRHTVSQAADRNVSAGCHAPLEQIRIAHHRHPQARFTRKVEAFWHHCDDGRGDTVDLNRGADDLRTRAVSPLPEAVRDDVVCGAPSTSSPSTKSRPSNGATPSSRNVLALTIRAPRSAWRPSSSRSEIGRLPTNDRASNVCACARQSSKSA